ncbi:MAG TPA: histidine phosphatase family protein [Gemmatimonadetes bacterium]|nr:histidine phosphatase family protein [Gemmatimonadota bacterium]
MNLVFVRHGVTQENTEGRLLGHADPPLSEEGRAQSQRLRERFLKEEYQPTHIYTSPLRRAAETANIVASSWLVPIVFWDDLMELGIGIFTGLTWDEIATKYPELTAGPQEFIDLDNVEGAESLASVRARSRRVIDTVIWRHANEDAVLIFAHGGILEYVLAWLLGTDRFWGVEVSNTGVFEFTLDQSRWSIEGDDRLNNLLWRIAQFNDVSHLT